VLQSHAIQVLGVSQNEIQQIVPAVLHEVKKRAVVDKPITEAEVRQALEGPQPLDGPFVGRDIRGAM
jgi:hypothetical protein